MSTGKFVFVVLACVFVAAPTAMSNPGQVKIPEGVDIAIFDSYLTGAYWPELYYCVPLVNGNPLYIPDFNYFARVDKNDDDEYLTNTKGEIYNPNSAQPECIQRPDTLTLMSPDKAEFVISTGAWQIFWTSDPSQYVWTLRCHAPDNSTHCAISAVDVGILVKPDPHDLPWDDVLKDLKQGTGLKFDDGNFKCFIVYGKRSLCLEC